MPDIQHRDIPDSGLHEIKGAATALVGSIPVADGVGGTSFQKLGVGSLTGSIPTSIPDISIVTDGSGGFKAGARGYACIQRTTSSARPLYPITLTNLVTPQGVFISGTNFQVQSTGLYHVTLTATITVKQITGSESEVLAPALTAIQLIRTGTAEVVGGGGTFIVQLFSGIDYSVSADGIATILGVQ